MASTVKLRRSANQGAVPTTAQLALGELAINTYDGKLYLKKNVAGNESIVDVGGGDSQFTSSLATTTATVLDLWSTSIYRSVKYIVQITQGTNYQVSELLLIHNGTTTTMAEYAVLETNGSLATLTSDINTGNVRLLITMGSASAATIAINRTTLAV